MLHRDGLSSPDFLLSITYLPQYDQGRHPRHLNCPPDSSARHVYFAAFRFGSGANFAVWLGLFCSVDFENVVNND
ncbi:hypothetical protein EYC80_009679 [Monilinia laxa]|uniref:Uncharacterized protein n=1 Tax=Monilinia laxa TaxID=61186 RepID=A0A5N6JYK4_MONLA|nr:hypothetical protein EYC80_009679 [Monilinia laxa]